MQFKIDENLPRELAVILREWGHDATTVLDQGLDGSSDPRVASICRDESRIMITLDIGFGDIRTYNPEQHPGIIVLRLRQYDRSHVIAIFRKIAHALRTEPLTQRLWIVDEHRIRIRK